MKKILILLLLPIITFAQKEVVIHIKTDNYPSETKWVLHKDSYPNGDTIGHVPYGYYTQGNTKIHLSELVDGAIEKNAKEETDTREVKNSQKETTHHHYSQELNNDNGQHEANNMDSFCIYHDARSCSQRWTNSCGNVFWTIDRTVSAHAEKLRQSTVRWEINSC